MREVRKMPAAYDVDNEVETPEEYKLQQSQNEMLSDTGRWIVQRVIEECENIVKGELKSEEVI